VGEIHLSCLPLNELSLKRVIKILRVVRDEFFVDDELLFRGDNRNHGLVFPSRVISDIHACVVVIHTRDEVACSHSHLVCLIELTRPCLGVGIAFHKLRDFRRCMC